MPGFKRVSLSGSDELFRPTRPEPEAEPELPLDRPAAAETAPAPPVAQAPQPSTVRPATPPAEAREKLLRTLHFSPDEIELLLDSVQIARFADKGHPKPNLERFEKLGELRLKLQGD